MNRGGGAAGAAGAAAAGTYRNDSRQGRLQRGSARERCGRHDDRASREVRARAARVERRSTSGMLWAGGDGGQQQAALRGAGQRGQYQTIRVERAERAASNEQHQ